VSQALPVNRLPPRGFWGPPPVQHQWVRRDLAFLMHFDEAHPTGASNQGYREMVSGGVMASTLGGGTDIRTASTPHGRALRMDLPDVATSPSAHLRNLFGVAFPKLAGIHQGFTIFMVHRYTHQNSNDVGQILGLERTAGAQSRWMYIKGPSSAQFKIIINGATQTMGISSRWIKYHAEPSAIAFVQDTAAGVHRIYFDGGFVGEVGSLTPLDITGIVRIGDASRKQNLVASGYFNLIGMATRAWTGNEVAAWSRDPYGFLNPGWVPPQEIPAPADAVVTVGDLRMPSETSIANGALIALGERRINSLNDSSRAAQILSGLFGDTRDELLRALPWRFATKRVQLEADATDPIWGFASAFTLPADCIRVMDVDNPYNWPWKVEGKKIVTQSPSPIRVEYTARIEDPIQMDSLFRQTLSAGLAVNAAEAFTSDTDKLSQVLVKFAKLFDSAKVANGQENDTPEAQPGEWERWRGREGRN